MVISKTQLAKQVIASRSSLYYKPKLPKKDLTLKEQIIQLWKDKTYSAYGHKRLALHLKLNKKRVSRVMKKFKLKQPKRRAEKPFKPEDLNNSETKHPNLLWDKKTDDFIPFTHPNQAWAQDFTYIWFMGRFWYVSTVIDIYTRKIIGFAVSDKHDTNLILQALRNALDTTEAKPEIIHSDQGSEYTSEAYQQFVIDLGIKLSYSKKSSPWQNGFQESYYNNFKLDLGNANQFETPGELAEGIYQTIFLYNTKRMHTSLKMTPQQFHQAYKLTLI